MSKPVEKSDKRSRGWCLTHNNYTEEDIAYYMAQYEVDNNLSYIIIGFEIAPKTKTPHLQMYLYYTNPVRFSALKKLFPVAHILPQKASKNASAYVYCMEEQDYWEAGERPQQGYRTDLAAITYDIRTGHKKLADVMKAYPNQYCQYFRPIQKYIDTFQRYDTVAIAYDSDDGTNIRDIYKYYDINLDYVVTHKYMHHPLELMHIYSSRKYRYIFYPISAFGEFEENILCYNIEEWPPKQDDTDEGEEAKP